MRKRICQLVEARLQRLLDEERELETFIDSSDPLALHLRGCRECCTLANALSVVVSGAGWVNQGGDAPDLASGVLAELRATAAAGSNTIAVRGSSSRWRAVVAMTLAASLLVAIGLREWTSPAGGEADGGGALAVSEVAAEGAPGEPTDTRWYPRGVGLASLSMAVLNSRNVEARQVATSTEEPLLERAMDAVRRVLPAWQPDDAAPNSKTGAWAPVLPQWV